MARRGRPKGVDSAETRQRIIDSARAEFARRGFAGSSVSTIASNAELAPSAVYHYFGGKAALYEAVFESTVDTIWSDINRAVCSARTLVENIESIVARVRVLPNERPHYGAFLAMVPIVARLRPEFGHLLTRRSQRQDETFRALAEIGLATGELAGFDRVGATEMLRALVMGWLFECHFRGDEPPGSGDALITLASLLAARTVLPVG